MRRVREAAPYGSAPAVTCSAKPGADVESHQLQFLESQGPVARNEMIKATQILRAGNSASRDRYASPVTGVLGGGRIWTRSVHPEPTPWRFFGDFLGVQKVTRRRSGEISPHTTNPIQNLPPHPPRMCSAPSPQGEGLKEIPRKKAAKRPPFSAIRTSVK